MSDLTAKLNHARLAVARARDDLRLSEDSYATTKAGAESDVMISAGDTAKALGSNAEDRARNLLLGISSIDYYQIALLDLRTKQFDLDNAQAYLDCLLDERRAQESRTRERYVTLLEGADQPIGGLDEAMVLDAR